MYQWISLLRFIFFCLLFKEVEDVYEKKGEVNSSTESIYFLQWLYKETQAHRRIIVNAYTLNHKLWQRDQ